MKNKLSKLTDKELYSALTGEKSLAEASFAEIYFRHSDRIYAYCLRVTGNDDDARDVFQDTFINFYNSVKDNAKVDNLSAYILRIARNLCLNYKRDVKINIELDDINYLTNDESYENKELMQLIARALDLLDFEYREAFILRLYQGLSYKEIGDITGESMSTVKNRVWRAKDRVKTILLPYLEDLKT